MREKEEIERTNLSVIMANGFETGEIFKASEETLQKYLALLCTQAVPNETVRHREIIRALTINHIQMQRHIDQLNTQNTRLQWLVIFLSILAFIATGYQIYKQSTTIPALIQQPTLNNPSTSSEPTAPTSKTSKGDPPSKPMLPQDTSQTPHQGTLKDSGIPSQSTYKDQKPSQGPPNEKK